MLPPSWSPTQQIRALVALHELAAHLAREARERTAYGNHQVADALVAVGRRALPSALTEIAGLPALRLIGSRDRLVEAVAQFAGSQPWAERTTALAATMLVQGRRFADAGSRIDRLASAIASVDERAARQQFSDHLTAFHASRGEHAAEDPATAAAWTRAISMLVGAAAGLGIPMITPELAPPAPVLPAAPAESTTPYRPASAIDEASNAGGSRALRRRG